MGIALEIIVTLAVYNIINVTVILFTTCTYTIYKCLVSFQCFSTRDIYTFSLSSFWLKTRSSCGLPLQSH